VFFKHPAKILIFYKNMDHQIHHEERYSLDVNELLRQQAARRVLERNKIHEVATLPVNHSTAAAESNPTDDDAEFTERLNRAKSPSVSPTSHHHHHHQQQHRSPSLPGLTEDTVVIAQLKSRITMLENESESLRAVVDLARKENAALRNLMLKLAKKSLGDDWKAELGIDLELGTALAGMGQPAAELTWSQRERLIGMLAGKDPCLLP
jgi:hypothetical protein